MIFTNMQRSAKPRFIQISFTQTAYSCVFECTGVDLLWPYVVEKNPKNYVPWMGGHCHRHIDAGCRTQAAAATRRDSYLASQAYDCIGF